ncbi:hypothetical protein COO60DRAFT_1627254 [Scenedesmus sp. NREL 46B-D3]|nr:hypothetical protein COO60DRAFT_1627254 [Scenedesmus sp. NREL 46B-D3]
MVKTLLAVVFTLVTGFCGLQQPAARALKGGKCRQLLHGREAECVYLAVCVVSSAPHQQCRARVPPRHPLRSPGLITLHNEQFSFKILCATPAQCQPHHVGGQCKSFGHHHREPPWQHDARPRPRHAGRVQCSWYANNLLHSHVRVEGVRPVSPALQAARRSCCALQGHTNVSPERRWQLHCCAEHDRACHMTSGLTPLEQQYGGHRTQNVHAAQAVLTCDPLLNVRR